MKILYVDLETTPNLGYVWGLFNQNIAITQLVSHTEVICFGAKWADGKSVIFKSTFHDGKEAMLAEMWNLLDQADVVVGWNSASFDSKHMMREFLEAGMLPPSPYKDLDLMRVVKSRFRMTSNKLDYVSQKLGIGAKVQHSGFDLWLKCMAGDKKAWTEMKRYQIQDVELLVPLHERLRPWIRSGPHVALHDGVEDGCRNCGGTDLVRRGYAITSSGRYQRFVCKTCGSWQRSGKSLSSTSMKAI